MYGDTNRGEKRSGNIILVCDPQTMEKKNEYLIYWKQETYEDLKSQVAKAVYNYNNKRIHNNIERQIPIMFYENSTNNKHLNNKKITIFNHQD